ncbi:MAG: PH domain-containing protein [Chloroflexi bacterium]|nr:PH domain-containing protein [Chloroflexota bacterium]
MSEWRPTPSPGGYVGLAILVVLAAGAGRLVWQMLSAPRIDLVLFLVGLGILVALALIGLFAYLTVGYFNLRYFLDRNGLVISWAGERQYIPMESVDKIVSGSGIDSKIRIRGINWPGYHVGHENLGERGELVVYSTVSLSRQLFICTPTLIYGISPRDPERFLKELELRRNLGITSFQRQMTDRSRLLSFPLWSDRGAHLLVASATILNLAMFAFLSQRYPGLPSRLPTHFNALGQVDLIGQSIEMFKIPFIGLIALLVNTVVAFVAHEWDRMGGYLLLGASGLVQIVLWIAMLNILF